MSAAQHSNRICIPHRCASVHFCRILIGWQSIPQERTSCCLHLSIIPSTLLPARSGERRKPIGSFPDPVLTSYLCIKVTYDGCFQRMSENRVKTSVLVLKITFMESSCLQDFMKNVYFRKKCLVMYLSELML